MPRESARVGEPGAHVERGACPGADGGVVGGNLGEGTQCVVEVGERMGRQRAAQVRRLHRARAAAGGDHVLLPERVPEPGRAGVRRLAALDRMAAHHTHEVAGPGPVGQRAVDRVVVQRLRERVLLAGPALGPGVGPAVERAPVVGVVVELVGGVEPRAVDIDGRVADVGEHEAARRLDPLRIAGRERAAEERRAGQRGPCQCLAALGQVQPAYAPSAHRRGPGGQSPVEVRQRLHVDDASAGALHDLQP